MAQKLMARLEFPAGQRGGPTPPIIQHDPRDLARGLLEDPEIPARDRVAAILVAIYAQPIIRVARLTIDRITITDTDDDDHARAHASDAARARRRRGPRMARVSVQASDAAARDAVPVAVPGQPAVTADWRAIAQPPPQAPRDRLQPRPSRSAAAPRRRDARPRSSPTSSASTSTPPRPGRRSPADPGVTIPPCAAQWSGRDETLLDGDPTRGPARAAREQHADDSPPSLFAAGLPRLPRIPGLRPAQPLATRQADCRSLECGPLRSSVHDCYAPRWRRAGSGGRSRSCRRVAAIV